MHLLRILALATCSLLAMGAVAQPAFPTRPVRIVVPYAPGGGVDAIARALAEQLQRRWGQPVVVDNKPGASTIIGTTAVTKAVADGHTLLLTSESTITSNPFLFDKLAYDPVRELAPVSRLISLPQMVVAHPSVAADNLDLLVAQARSGPPMAYATYGSGSLPHLLFEGLRARSGIALIQVPYKGIAPAVMAVLGGESQLTLAGVPSALGHIQAGKLKPLAVARATRLAALPQVPTLREAGYGDIDPHESWFGLFATAGTPPAVLQQIHRDVAEIGADPGFRERNVTSRGFDAVFSTPQELAIFIEADHAPEGAADPHLRSPGGMMVPAVHALPERGEFVVRGGHVLTMDSTLGEVARGDVHVCAGRIVAVGAGLRVPGAQDIDAADMIVLPGFVDTHWHLWNSALRALVRGDDPEQGYFPVTLRLGPRFTPDDSLHAVRLGVAEGLASGITTVHDWCHNARSPAHVDAELRALRELGIRARFSYGWGQDTPLEQPMNLDDLARLQRQGLDTEGLLTLGAALRTPVANPRGAVPIGVLRAEFAAVRRLGLPITMHARPGIVSLLETHGLLGPDLQLVHPQGLSGQECATLAARGTHMSCSPVIEMLYAQAQRGEIQFQELQAHGVPQSLSVDSSSASANADFFGCMRALLWSHKQRFGSREPLSARRLLQLATIDGARDLGLDAQVGSLTPGKRADLVLVRATDLNIGPVLDPAHALVYSAQPANVDTVIVDGRVLLRAGEFTALDRRQLMRDAATSVQRFAGQGRLPCSCAG